MKMQYTLYDYLPSGNGYKVRLTAKYLNVPYRLVQVDIAQSATRTPQFLAKNPNGRIPLLEVPGRGYLSESHAIIGFLAEGSELIPADPWARASLWQWLCFEQYNLEPNIATVRFWLKTLRKTEQELGDRLTEKIAKGFEALGVLERGLEGKEFLVADRFTLADIALYAYTHVAPEGGFPLEAYPRIQAWIQRVAAQPRHAPITAA
ncbi:MAG TPA: glutathione S-transferase family protein [Steroidobacteraceae bacterium]|jgi:glutathione S-transferase|nr:glutathione S-transferase family protein [Steroidobacteraceae bacterium]